MANGKRSKDKERAPRVKPSLPKQPEQPKGPDSERRRLIAFLIIPLIFFAILQVFVLPKMEIKQLSYSQFYDLISENPSTSEVESAELVEDVVRGKL
jgi:hypothetical protein